MSYGFDNANRLTGITQGSTSVGLSYDTSNRRTCLTLPNGVIATYGYDNDSRVTSITYGTGGSCASPPSNLGNLTYSYDAIGRRLALGGSLAAVTLPGNVSGGGTAYNADNEQARFLGVDFTYDANGNLTADANNSYTWDARNYLTAISGSGTASFVYDALGRRQKKVVNSATTQFLYDELNPVRLLNGAAPPAVTANLLDGLNIDEHFKTSAGGGLTFMTDALGSPLEGWAATIETTPVSIEGVGLANLMRDPPALEAMMVPCFFLFSLPANGGGAGPDPNRYGI